MSDVKIRIEKHPGSLGERLRSLADTCDANPAITAVVFTRAGNLEISLGVSYPDDRADAISLAYLQTLAFFASSVAGKGEVEGNLSIPLNGLSEGITAAAADLIARKAQAREAAQKSGLF